MAELNGSNKEASDFGPNVHISQHAVIAHKVTYLRSSTTHHGTFRAILRELTYHLGYEATSTLTTEPVAISVPIPSASKEEEQHMDWEGKKLKEHVSLIPILRSGQGMIEAMLELIPNASVYHVGMYKVAGSQPVQYYNRLPRKCENDVAYVLDPVIATSSTVLSVIKILKKVRGKKRIVGFGQKLCRILLLDAEYLTSFLCFHFAFETNQWGVPKIHVISVIASRAGLKSIVDAHPDVNVTVATIDEKVTDDGVVLPGLGDPGDRQFGTANIYDDEESLLHPSRRKRTLSQSLD